MYMKDYTKTYTTLDGASGAVFLAVIQDLQERMERNKRLAADRGETIEKLQEKVRRLKLTVRDCAREVGRRTGALERVRELEAAATETVRWYRTKLTSEMRGQVKHHAGYQPITRLAHTIRANLGQENFIEWVS
jgi:hypothetical protein